MAASPRSRWQPPYDVGDVDEDDLSTAVDYDTESPGGDQLQRVALLRRYTRLHGQRDRLHEVVDGEGLDARRARLDLAEQVDRQLGALRCDLGGAPSRIELLELLTPEVTRSVGNHAQGGRSRAGRRPPRFER